MNKIDCKRFFDYHTHTLEHGWSKPLRIEETIRTAIESGLPVICLTDHYPLPPGFEDPTLERDCAMPMSRYLKYQELVSKTVEKYRPQIEILRGAEFDWLPEYKEWTEGQIKKWPFDYVIGSVHFLGQIEDKKGKRNFVIDYKQDEFMRGVTYYRGIRPLVEAYYGEVRAMVQIGIFDGVGHIDLIKKYNEGNLFTEDEEWYRRTVLETLGTIANSGMVIEINTSGWDKRCESAYPSFWILKEANRQSIELTIGSDSHTPKTIGRNLDRAVLLAQEAGYKKLIKYKKRKKLEVIL